MIKRLLSKLITTVAPPIDVIEKPVIADSIYTQLKSELDNIGSMEIDLSKIPASMREFETYSSTLRLLVKTLVEVNNAVESMTPITRDFILLRELKTVTFDDFLFVEDKFYVENPGENLMMAFDHIERYYELMKDADKAKYGALEHNHRQLYKFTQILTEFINFVVYYFGR